MLQYLLFSKLCGVFLSEPYLMERQFFLKKTGKAGGGGASQWVEVSSTRQEEVNSDV